jgi:A/G-specific adenine glycosylase
VRHTFTHFHLILRLETARLPRGFEPAAGSFWPPASLEAALPSVMRKALKLGLATV